MSGQWFAEETLSQARNDVPIACERNSTHESISQTMPFCRHCGTPMPNDVLRGDQ